MGILKPLHQLKTFRTSSQNSLKALTRELTDLKITTTTKRNYITPRSFCSRKEWPEKKPQMLFILIFKALAVWHNILVKKARKALKGLGMGLS